MVKVREESQSSDYDRLETMIEDLCEKHGFKLYTTGWSRKTFDVYRDVPAERKLELMVRVESLATTSGEIHFYDEAAADFAAELGAALEQTFEVAEAVLIKSKRPS